MRRLKRGAVVTVEMLRQKYACPNKVALFRRTFPASQYPKGVRVTRTNLQKAGRAGLDVDWFAGTFASPAVYRTYDALQDEACRALEEERARRWMNQTLYEGQSGSYLREDRKLLYAIREKQALALWEALKES